MRETISAINVPYNRPAVTHSPVRVVRLSKSTPGTVVSELTPMAL